ncbi:hypothetical protein [Virgibacillus chiguensis]|uniref:Uncharacterized protein n=1 Tax=Virgibacillus chiguensis TaxID=411959 RepID=A0A1M5WQK0_9BACI|nr:hypothetical protein [Virgibacillus chiguensis]SHH89876.1 hypothetical protein SAMN05421807_11822 [Virgibacillus chiguensis]
MDGRKWGKEKIIQFLKRFGWYIHFLIFLLFQVLFQLFAESNVWVIFNLNDYGKWAVSEFYWLVETFHIHQREELNYVTVVWGIAFILHGGTCLMNKYVRKNHTIHATYSPPAEDDW